MSPANDYIFSYDVLQIKENQWLMKNILGLTFCFILAFQLPGQIPDLQIKDTTGSFFNLPNFLENDRNYAIIFWSAQDAPSTSALGDYHNYYDNWLNDHELEFLTINIDEENLHDGVVDYFNQQGWQYSLFFSPATDVTQAFGINQIPYLYLINKSHEIIYEVAGWLQGDLLNEEISQNFPVSLNEHNPLKEIHVYALNKNIIIESANAHPLLSTSIFTIDGKLILHKNYEYRLSNTRSIDTRSLSTGTIVVVRIVSQDGKSISRKIMIR